MKRILLLLLLLLFLVVRSFSAEIVLEVEDFKGKGRLWGKKYYSGKGIFGKWKKLTQQTEIPKAGKYYIWVRYNYNWQVWGIKNLRDFSLTLNGKKHIINQDVGNLGYLVLEEYLPAGKLNVIIERIGGDPYADVIIITDDPKYMPPRRMYIFKGKWHNDIIVNKPVAGTGKKVEIPKTKAPVIDGKLNEAAWKNAAAVNDFRLCVNGRAPDFPTKVSLCHDGENLFLGFRCKQPSGKLVSTAKIFNGDCIEVAFSTSGGKYPVYHLIVNPKGNVYTEKIVNGIGDSNWNPANWKIVTATEKNQYHVEISIPFASVMEKLSFEPALWRGNFCRSTVEKRESSTWSKTRRGYAAPSGFGNWVFEDINSEDFAKIYWPILEKKLEISGEKNTPVNLNFAKMLSLQAVVEKKMANELLPPNGKAFVFEKMNLLPNPGFEYGAVGINGVSPVNWYATKGGTAFLDRKAHRGKFALAIAKTDKDFSLQAGVKPLIDYKIPYRLSGYVQGENVTGKNFIKVTWYVPDTIKAGGWGQIKPAGETISPLFKGSFPYRRFAIDCIPPKDAVQCSFEICSEDNQGILRFDDIEFDGLGSLPVEIMIPQPGFEAKGLKEAVIFSRQPLEKKKFTVHCAEKTVFSGMLKPFGISEFNRHAYTADFSSLKTTGKYVLSLVENGKKIQSHEFEIKKNLYLDYAKFASNFYYVQRQGIDIPGWHKANFLDDAALWDPVKRKIVGHRDVSGGWQDAGDPSKQTQDDLSIYALSSFYETVKPEWRDLKEKYPDIISLADWGVKRYVEKVYAGDGLFYPSTVNNPPKRRKIHGVDPANWTDNISGTWDDRLVINKTSMQWHISQLLRYAIVIKPFNPALASKITKMIKLNYAKRKNEKTVFYRARLKYDFLFKMVRHEGELLRNAMLLYRLTRKKEYATDAKKYATSIAKTLKNQFYLKKTMFDKVDGYTMMRSFPFFISACFEYLERNEHQKLEDALRQYVKNVIGNFSKKNEFGIIATNRPQKRVIADGGVNNQLVAAYGYVAAQAARRWKNPEYLRIAERCVQWVTGRNPRNISMLIGNGWKFAATSSTVAAYSPGHGDGVLPGAVIRGIRQQDGTPENYPAINVSTNPGGLALSRYHEVYQIDVAMFLLACGEIHKALEEL